MYGFCLNPTEIYMACKKNISSTRNSKLADPLRLKIKKTQSLLNTQLEYIIESDKTTSMNKVSTVMFGKLKTLFQTWK